LKKRTATWFRAAERSVEADPLLPGAGELLTVAVVLLASQSMGPAGHPSSSSPRCCGI
jgi:hypothetical protein